MRAARSDRHLLACSSITLISRGFSKFAQILFLVIAARLLSVEEFASYPYLIVLAAAFTIMSDTGVPLVPVGTRPRAGRSRRALLVALPIVVVDLAGGRDPPSRLRRHRLGPGSSFVPVLLTALFVVFNRFFDLDLASC